MDIKMLRDEATSTAANTFNHVFPRDSFLKLGPDTFGALLIYGGTNLGKSVFAADVLKKLGRRLAERPPELLELRGQLQNGQPTTRTLP